MLARARLRIALVALLAVTGAFAVPSAASAWIVTVHVHGAGKVAETTPRLLMDCTVSPDGMSDSCSTDCVADTQAGLYAHGDIINLRASVPTGAYNRGWRFLKYVDSSAGGGQINCDPQNLSGDHVNVNCQFQIFENLQTNLYFQDIDGPQDTTVGGGPPNYTNVTGASFYYFAPSDPDATFECKLDRPGQPGTFAPCANTTYDSRLGYSGLTLNGPYAFSVRGKDPSGNLDLTPVTWAWTVDTINPSVSIVTPANGGYLNSTGFTPSSTVTDATATTRLCSLDSAAFGSCAAVSGLNQGSHSFSVKATDAAGNQSTATSSFTVDSVNPIVSIVTPAQGSYRNSTGFTPSFTASDTHLSSVTCAVGAAAFSACGPVSGLAQGLNAFSVRAIDSAGNETVVTNSFTVDTLKPTTRLTASPRSPTTSRRATFRFNSPSDSAGVHFRCKLDGRAATNCASPKTYRNLRLGRHTFKVWAVDQAGNRDVTPAIRAWRIVSG